jgi:gluconate 2-dehydrogenase gamma chain
MLPLNESEIRTLTCVIDRIVPADEFPSASQADCVEFLLRIIQRENLGELYRSGLKGLEIESTQYGRIFCDLDFDKQDEIIARCMNLSKRATWDVSPKRFLDLLAQQTVEGYYSDPGNGGNRGAVAWRMVGFEVRG